MSNTWLRREIKHLMTRDFSSLSRVQHAVMDCVVDEIIETINQPMCYECGEVNCVCREVA